MTRRALEFFGTKEDMTFILRNIESARRLQYVLSGLFESPEVATTDSLLNDPSFGIVEMGDSNHTPRYLVSDRGIPIEVRSIPQRRGGIRYVVDQVVNHRVVLFQPSGVFGENSLIAGQASTVSSDPVSIDLYGLFRSEIRRHFAKVKSYYVGRQAGEWLDKGWRLTASVRSPTLYDLSRT